MTAYSVVQAFFIAPTPEEASVNSGMDTWTFATREEAKAQFQQLLTELQKDPDYQAGQAFGGFSVEHTQTAERLEITVCENGIVREVVTLTLCEGEAKTAWETQQTQHQARVLAHFADTKQYVVTQSAVADDEVSNLVASSIITWTFTSFAAAQELAIMLREALQEDYPVTETANLRIVHFTGLNAESDYRIEVSENGAPTEVVMVELHQGEQATLTNWWEAHAHQHEKLVQTRFGQ